MLRLPYLRNKSHRHRYQKKFHLNPTVNNTDMTNKHIIDAILRQPVVPLSTTTVENLKLFGQEVTEL